MLALAVLLPVLGGCYSFTGESLPSHIKTIAIPSFDNETLEPGVGQEVTSGVTDQFITDGRLKLASDTAADSRLEGEIVLYENKVNNFTADRNPLDYIVILKVSIELRDQVKNRSLWKDEGLVATASYAPGADSGPTTEEEARLKAIEDLANDIVTKTLEQW